MSVIDEVAAMLAADLAVYGPAPKRSVFMARTVIPTTIPGRRYRGRRARRQAFYARQRCDRHATRTLEFILNDLPAINIAAQADDLIRYGTTWLEVSEAGGIRRVPAVEWRAVDFAKTRDVVPR